ncbi:GNAT family N-acetyltransferase [Natronospira bacteriovora]|uniref:Peptidogalycan biosysnthesis protein n=1 Tax=Natronospira bacteriovora TaxID=3069753 RepID=A0ABU0WCQ1_9GAMM|nr:GNAT family N-acetyltransferase [Natronospira sp. AB-CW4]MDQ2070710.1 peptidogalycan biosysnthesis protein [Natronospira sp. AB-CW4]
MHTLACMADVPAADWNALVDSDQPALRHEFLHQLEFSRAATPDTGWVPAHRLEHDSQGGLMAALPLYEKQHSFGEFVFDFALADAWQRQGLAYYPKLLSAIPFSPLPGPRLLGQDDSARERLAVAMESMADGERYSTAHVLFCLPRDLTLLRERGWISRHGCRFLWQNQGHETFDDWLRTFRAKKRKNLLRERRRVHDQGVRFLWREGEALASADWTGLYALYARTYHLRGQRPYLPPDFFRGLAGSMPGQLLIIEAYDREDELIAMAFCLKGTETLYGRHWGAARDLDGLHFETCYYQGIDYCLQNRLRAFDPGTQGEHKLLRGFEPIETASMHWIPSGPLRRAVADYAAAEARHNQDYMNVARQHLPFHRDAGEGP